MKSRRHPFSAQKMFLGMLLFVAFTAHSEPIALTFIEPRAFFENPTYYENHWTYEVDEDGPYYFMATPGYSYKFCETKEGAMSSNNCYYIIDTKMRREDEAAGIGPGDGSKYIVESKRIPDSKKNEMWKLKDGIFTFARFDLTFYLKPDAGKIPTKPTSAKVRTAPATIYSLATIPPAIKVKIARFLGYPVESIRAITASSQDQPAGIVLWQGTVAFEPVPGSSQRITVQFAVTNE